MRKKSKTQCQLTLPDFRRESKWFSAALDLQRNSLARRKLTQNDGEVLERLDLVVHGFAFFLLQNGKENITRLDPRLFGRTAGSRARKFYSAVRLTASGRSMR